MYFDTQDIGFVTFAHNTSKVDYLRLAYLQALNIISGGVANLDFYITKRNYLNVLRGGKSRGTR